MRSVIAAVSLSIFAFATLGHSQVPDVSSQTRTFLDAYSRGDAKAVLRSVDEDTVAYGSDASEIFHGPIAISSMIENDALLWGGQARIGDMHEISIQSGGKLQTIFFQAPFTITGRPPVQVRFCMVWRNDSGRWHLLQSSNSVVTEGQSAKQLLEGSQHK
jgi:ketosteroid isomerase-like protein